MFYQDFDQLEREHYAKMLDEVRREHQLKRIFKRQHKFDAWLNDRLSGIGDRLIHIGERLQQHDAPTRSLKISHPPA